MSLNKLNADVIRSLEEACRASKTCGYARVIQGAQSALQSMLVVEQEVNRLLWALKEIDQSFNSPSGVRLDSVTVHVDSLQWLTVQEFLTQESEAIQPDDKQPLVF